VKSVAKRYFQMNRCKRCIIPDTVPSVIIDKDGICSFCADHKEQKYLGEEKLGRIIGAIKSTNSKYDCIVPVSGGRDSTFVLYMAKAVYDLRVLAVNYDNEFLTDAAVANMKRACKILNVDYISIRSERDVYHKIVLHGIRAVLSLGLHEISGALCRACSYGYKSAVYRCAEAHRVPLILWGESPIEPGRDMWSRVTEGLRKSKLLKLLNINFYVAEYYMLLQRFELRVPRNSILSRKPPVLRNQDIREVQLFDYVKWDRRRIKETIMTKLGWEASGDHVSSWKADCLLHSLSNYCYFRMLGCTQHCIGYCLMINSGQMSRETALKQEKRMAAALAGSVPKMARDEIGLSERELAKIESF
jgi:hypothetical protein